MRTMVFELRGFSWTPTFITQLGDVLAELSDVFSKSIAHFGSCPQLTFEVSLPPSSSPVTA